MKLRFLYTLGLLLCLSNFASPNECARHCPLAAASAGQAAPAASSKTPATSSTAPAASAPESSDAATQPAAGQGESNSPTLIKLLYI